MIAYKGFTKELTATKGKGTFKFETGKTYEEKECKCANNGFHCAEEPLCAMSYYGNMTDRYFIVKAEGDINQDGYGSRISCTKITLLKEIGRAEMGACACKYIYEHPDRETNTTYVKLDKGKCNRKGDFIIVRGKNPVAAGTKGSYLFLLKEKKNSKEIMSIYAAYVDGTQVKANTYYSLRGERLCEKKI